MLPTPFILANNLLQPTSTMPDRLHHLLLRKPDLASSIFRNADLSSDNMSPEELLFLRQLLQNYSRLCDGMHIPQLCQPVTPLLPIEKGSSISCGASAAGSIMQHSEDCFHQSNFGSVKPKPTVQPQLLSNHPSSESKILLQCGSIPSVNIIVGNNVTSSGLPLSVAQSCNKSVVEEVITKRYEESACTPRPRWCPTPEQIQLLEALFNSGTTTPSRDMIVQIAGRLKQYGNIAEANVFYWFQNRKARAKRKLQLPTGSDGGCVGKEGRNTRRRVSTKTRFEKKSEEVTDMTEKAFCQDHNLLRQSFSMGMSVGELGRIHPAINIPEIQQNLMNTQTANVSAHNYWSTQLPAHSLVAHQQMQQLGCSTMDNFQTVVHTPQLSSSSSVEDTVSFSQQINLTDAALHQLSSSNVHPQQSSLDVVTSKLPSCSPGQDIAGYPQQNFVPTEFSVTTKSNKPQENIACYINSQQRFHGSPPQVCTSKVEESVLCSHQNYLLAAQCRRWLETSKGLSEKQFCDLRYHDNDPLQKIQNQACLQQKALQDTEAQMQTAVTLRPPNVASATKNTISSISVISESKGSNLVSPSQAAQDCYEVTSMPISTTPMLNSTAADSLVVSSLPEMINDYEISLWEAFTGSYGAWESESR